MKHGFPVVWTVLLALMVGITASAIVYILFIQHETYGSTLPSGSLSQSFILEVILTFILMLTIINFATGTNEKGIIAGVAIGSVVDLEALFQEHL